MKKKRAAYKDDETTGGQRDKKAYVSSPCPVTFSPVISFNNDQPTSVKLVRGTKTLN